MKNIKFYTLLIAIITTLGLSAQVSINNDGTDPDGSAMLDVQSTDKGMLVPRMTTAQRTAISIPATGLMVFDTDTGSFWFYNGSTWQEVGADNLGNHTATQHIKLGGYTLSGDGDPEGITVAANGNVGINLGGVQTVLGIWDKVSLGYVGITQNKLAGLSSMEFTTSGSNGDQATRFSIQGATNTPDISFYTGDQGSESTTLFIEGSSGNVGIGTTTPDRPLNIVEVAGTGELAKFESNSGNGLEIDGWFNGANIDPILSGDNFYFGRDVSLGNFIIQSGNVGIGTTTPSSRLDVGGGNISLNGGWLSNDGDDEGISINNTGNIGIGTSPTTTTKFRVDNDGVANYSGFFGSQTSGCTPLGIIGPNDGTMLLRAMGNGSTVFMVQGNGRVGIGTTDPTQAKVVINGSVSSTLSYGYLNSSGNTGTNSGTNSYSLYASDRIAASEFNAHSDNRIKNIIGLSQSADDLNTLMKIEITNYTLRDTVAKGTKPHKKVIAQQVAEVYPQAVTRNLSEVVPDIYQRAQVKDDWIMLATNLKAGDRVKIITEENAEVYEVSQVKEGGFQVAELQTSNFELQSVFVYGREVKDFHTVDYEAIAMLNVSATQEQQRRIEILETENQLLKEQISELNQLKAIVEQLRQSISSDKLEADISDFAKKQ